MKQWNNVREFGTDLQARAFIASLQHQKIAHAIWHVSVCQYLVYFD